MAEETFFSAKGRLRRKDFLIRELLLAVPALFIATLSDEFGLYVFQNLIVIVYSVLYVIQSVKRLHDLDLNGWYSLISLIPIANLIFGLQLILKDGTPGSNIYGDDPKGRVLTTNSLDI